jgi:hypothetical protein
MSPCNTLCHFFTYWCSFMTIPWCKLNKKLGFHFQMQHYWAFFVLNNKIDLNVSYYFVSLEKMIIDFSFNKIWSQKENCLLHMYTLKLNKIHMSAINVQRMDQQDSMWMLPLLWTLIKCMHIDIIIHKNNMCTQMVHKIFIHTHTLKKKKNQWIFGNEKQFNVKLFF